MDRKFNVKIVRTYKYCPKCTGMMVPCNFSILSGSGTSLLSVNSTFSPSMFSDQTFTTQTFNHRCDKCGHGENYDKTYPILEYIDDGELG